MYRKLIAVATALGVMLAGFAAPPPAQAQDFNSLVRSATNANVQLVEQIRTALAAGDLTTLQARTRTALGTSEQVENLLTQALNLAPDDPSRSRVEGVLVHIEAATASLRMALQETTLNAARGRLEQARGEAEEALTEIQPFAQELPAREGVAEAPAVRALPPTGSPVGYQLVPAAVGALLIFAGLGLRRRLLVTP